MGTARSAGLKGLLGWSLLWIVLCSVAAELWMVYCWQPFTHPTETARLTSSWMEFRDCEVMLIGSSLAELGLASPTIAEVVEEQLGRKPCVLNLGQRGLSAESAVSYLRAVLARSTPEVMIWGTSPQECMVQNEGHFLKAFAAPSDVLRASWEGPATVEDAKRVLSAVFRPPALLVQATVFAGSCARIRCSRQSVISCQRAIPIWPPSRLSPAWRTPSPRRI